MVIWLEDLVDGGDDLAREAEELARLVVTADDEQPEPAVGAGDPQPDEVVDVGDLARAEDARADDDRLALTDVEAARFTRH